MQSQRVHVAQASRSAEESQRIEQAPRRRVSTPHDERCHTAAARKELLGQPELRVALEPRIQDALYAGMLRQESREAFR